MRWVFSILVWTGAAHPPGGSRRIAASSSRGTHTAAPTLRGKRIRERLVPPASKSHLAGWNPRRAVPRQFGRGLWHLGPSTAAGGRHEDRLSPSCAGCYLT